MKAVILAGGMGKRCLPLCVYEPKFMWKFLGKPLAFHLIDKLKETGIKEIIFVLGESAEQTKKEIINLYPDLKFEFTLQEQPLGMADALRTAESLIKEDHFIVLNANDVFQSELIRRVIEKYKTTKSDIVLAGRKTNEFDKYAFFKIQNGKAYGAIEKPNPKNAPSDIGAIGIWLLPKTIFENFRKYQNEEYLFEKGYDEMIKTNGAELIIHEDYFDSYKAPHDILRLTDLFTNFIKERKIHPDAKVSDKATIDGNVIIEEGAKILENATIRGPCYIGKNTIIANNSLILPNSHIGENCVIGSSEIKHSYIGDDVWVHRAYVGDSIIEGNCNIAAGTVLANYRFDEKNIFINVKDKKIDTGTNKFGAIMAKHCKTGVNSVIYPGVKLGPNSIVFPGAVLENDLSSGKIITRTGEIRDNKINMELQSKAALKEKLAKSLFR